VHDLFARQMCGQGTAHRRLRRCGWRLLARCVSQQRLGGFELFETELQLRDAFIELFRGAPEVQTAKPRQLHFKFVDLDLTSEKQRTLLYDELL
jgi:hypothetical protein